jgi:hypothetical protein
VAHQKKDGKSLLNLMKNCENMEFKDITLKDSFSYDAETERSRGQDEKVYTIDGRQYHLDKEVLTSDIFKVFIKISISY